MKHMKLKYFMRGLGCGIVFAVVLIMVTTKDPTDAEVIKQAEKLGMVMQVEEKNQSDKLADLNADTVTVTPEKDVNATDTTIEDASNAKAEDASTSEKKTEDANPSDTATENTKPEDTKTSDIKSEDTKATDEKSTDEKPKDVTTTEPKTVKEVTFQVSKGMYSYAVATLLEEKGLIKNAKDFDHYLIRNGYQDEIQSGTYSIKAGSSYESIAETITK